MKVEYAISLGIDFQGVSFEGWYFCKEFVDFLESNEKDWITGGKFFLQRCIIFGIIKIWIKF
ncbi:MAG: hypothetical protein AB1397_06525 [bacterium]